MNDFILFKRIIFGDLQPHKIDINDLSLLENEFKFILKIEDEDVGFEEHRYLPIFKNKEIELKIDTETGENTLKIKDDEGLEELINIDIPPYNDEKSRLYLQLIEFEIEINEIEINDFIKGSTDIKTLQLYALKNIHELKELAKELSLYKKRISTTGKYPYQANEYVVLVLKKYLISLIMYIQEIFSTFFHIEKESEVMLRYLLFDENISSFSLSPTFSIFPILPKEEKYERLKKGFIEENKNHNINKSRKDFSFGEYAFQFYKKEFNDDLLLFKNEKLFWERILMTNKIKIQYFDNYINHPQIEKILIPLIDSEIQYLEKLKIKEMNSFKNIPKYKILFLTSNPADTSRLRIDKEAREIEEGLRLANKRDSFDFKVRLATRPKDLSRSILDENPHILHFSGHGESEGIILEDENGISKIVTTIAISNLLSLFKDTIKCVILNSCYSENQAQEISKYIPFVIGMSKAIPDPTAIVFATSFYDAIGAGRDIEFAFKFGVSNISLEGLKGNEIPVLLKKTN